MGTATSATFGSMVQDNDNRPPARPPSRSARGQRRLAALGNPTIPHLNTMICLKPGRHDGTLGSACRRPCRKIHWHGIADAPCSGNSKVAAGSATIPALSATARRERKPRAVVLAKVGNAHGYAQTPLIAGVAVTSAPGDIVADMRGDRTQPVWPADAAAET